MKAPGGSQYSQTETGAARPLPTDSLYTVHTGSYLSFEGQLCPVPWFLNLLTVLAFFLSLPLPFSSRAKAAFPLSIRVRQHVSGVCKMCQGMLKGFLSLFANSV